MLLDITTDYISGRMSSTYYFHQVLPDSAWSHAEEGPISATHDHPRTWQPLDGCTIPLGTLLSITANPRMDAWLPYRTVVTAYPARPELAQI